MSSSEAVSDVLRKVDEDLVEGAEEVMSSLQIDRHQMSETWNRALALAVHSSPVQQFGISFGVGWLSGYLFRKGASALGLIKVNWRRLGGAVQSRLNRVQSFSHSSERPITTKLIQFCQRHVYITSGFTTGAVVAITF